MSGSMISGSTVAGLLLLLWFLLSAWKFRKARVYFHQKELRFAHVPFTSYWGRFCQNVRPPRHSQTGVGQAIALLSIPSATIAGPDFSLLSYSVKERKKKSEDFKITGKYVCNSYLSAPLTFEAVLDFLFYCLHAGCFFTALFDVRDANLFCKRLYNLGYLFLIG